ncbi:MAG: two-component system LytT family response regulator [Spirosomataceae bacterium]|jgi:two-component system LytT family response regulator
MKKITILLIDDEPLALKRLARLLEDYTDTIEIIGSAENGLEAVGMIQKLQPEVIFLDIQMPGLNGFEVLQQLPDPKPKVIFATAYDQYAIKAFDENSLDYLLKPIQKERLQQSIEKLKSSSTKEANPSLISELISQLKPKKEIHSITVKQGGKLIFVPLKEVSYFEASGKYVVLHTLEGRQHLINYTITSLNDRLDDSEFLQISRGTLVNVRQIKMLEKFFNGKYRITLNDKKQTEIESGSTYGNALKELTEL